MIVAILQARMSSRRLPGKVLAPILDVPMIFRQIERVRRSSRIDTLVVATSTESSDDRLSEMLVSEEVHVHRGSLDNVLERFAQIVDATHPEHIVRLTADCPLADHRVIDNVIDRHLQSGADYTSNVLQRTFPDGLDVEILTVSAFSRLRALPLTQEEREHVTLAIHSRPQLFTSHSVQQETDLSHHRWTVDLRADLEFVRTIYDRLYLANPDFGQDDIVALIRDEPHLARTSLGDEPEIERQGNA